MKSYYGTRMKATAMYVMIAVLFVAFFVYMGIAERVSVTSVHHVHEYTQFEDYQVKTVVDETAPVGVRTVYHWTLDGISSHESCLCFYVSHYHAQVLIDGETVFSLQADEGNKVGGSVSSNWVTVPLYDENNGMEIEVVLTPLFESVVDAEQEFLFGSHFAIVLDQLRQDIPQVFMSLLCIILGLVMIAVQLYFLVFTHTRSLDMVYLGFFSIVLGLWRITGMKSSPLLFEGNPMVLGYITIGALLLCGMSLLLYASTLFSEEKAKPLLWIAMVEAVVLGIVLVLQIFGVADFKEMLFVSHVMLIIAILSVPVLYLVYRSRAEGNYIHANWKYFLFISVGVVIDMTLFFVSGLSTQVIYTIFAFLVYTVVVFITSILETTRKAYVDEQTGLVNRAKWNELLSDHTAAGDMTGLVMIDLNGLKQINDTYGHEAGDRQILRFADLLRDSFPHSAQICRWGGDEFAIMTVGMEQDKLGDYIDGLARNVDKHNEASHDLPVAYALGWVFSSEYPELNCRELVSVADARMYQNKLASKQMK